PPGCKVNAPSLGYFSTETMFVFLLSFCNLECIDTLIIVNLDLKVMKKDLMWKKVTVLTMAFQIS
ncbi:hypothetical protein HMI56_002883, partial [Coelomomyces lativittatus]